MGWLNKGSDRDGSDTEECLTDEKRVWQTDESLFSQKEVHSSGKRCIIEWVVIVSACLLVSIAETDRKFEPMLACKSSSGPDRFNVLCYQVLHLHLYCLVMDPQKVSANSEAFCKIHLIFVFCIAGTDVHPGNDGGTEVVKDSTCPYFLYDVLVFFGVECFKAQWVLEVPEWIFLVPYADILEMPIKFL